MIKSQSINDPGLYIGTCSWKYPSWKGLIYSEGVGSDYLREYAKYYNTVEIDQWFWSLHDKKSVSLPKTNTVQDYVRSVPKDFKFSVKIPNSVTLSHFYKKYPGDHLIPNPYFFSIGLFRSFLKAMAPMKHQLGALIFQFEYLNKHKMMSQQTFLQVFENFVLKLPKGYTYAVEIRNPNYLNDRYFQFLKEHGLYHVFIQGYYMPSIFTLYKKFGQYITNLTIIRLLGPDRYGIEARCGGKWDQIVDAKEDEIEAVIQMIEDLLSKEIHVYLNVNNHYEGSAPLTINKIKQRLTPSA